MRGEKPDYKGRQMTVKEWKMKSYENWLYGKSRDNTLDKGLKRGILDI